MAGRRESGSFGSPPQRLGRQSVQQAEPAPTRLRVPRRTLRRLPVQQQLQHGLRVLVIPAVPLQPPSVRFPTDASQGRITGPRSHFSRGHQNGRKGIYEIPSLTNGGDEDGVFQSAPKQPGIHGRADPLHPPPHTDISHLHSPSGARVRRQSVPPREPAGLITRFPPQKQRKDTILHR